MISEQLNLPKTIVHEIVIENFGLTKVCAKMVPNVLTNGQKQIHLVIYEELLNLLIVYVTIYIFSTMLSPETSRAYFTPATRPLQQSHKALNDTPQSHLT